MDLSTAVSLTKTIRKQQYQSGRATAIDFKYLPREKQLYLQALTISSDKSRRYKTTLVFDKIANSDNVSDAFPVPYSTKTGVYGTPEIFIERPTLKSQVRCRCQCQDFYFMWSYFNRQNKALVGPHKTYVRVSPPSGRPPVNPSETPGLCKHLLSMVKELMVMGLLPKDRLIWSYVTQAPKLKE